MLLVPVSRHSSSLSLLPSCRNREILELGLDNEDSEHENDEDTNQSKKDKCNKCPVTTWLSFKITSLFFSFRFNFAGQGWGPSSRWNGSESSFLPSLWLHDLLRLHPTQPLWRSLARGHSTGRPAAPPAGQRCWSVHFCYCFCQEMIKICLGES